MVHQAVRRFALNENISFSYLAKEVLWKYNIHKHKHS